MGGGRPKGFSAKKLKMLLEKWEGHRRVTGMAAIPRRGGGKVPDRAFSHSCLGWAFLPSQEHNGGNANH